MNSGGASSSWLGLGCLSIAWAMAGCAMDSERSLLREHHAAGRYDLAIRALDETRDKYGDKNQVLWLLDRGAVALAVGDCERCIADLNQAEELTEASFGGSVGEDAARWLINDNAAPYHAAAYEDMYINVLKLMAQLERGANVGGATVEARRMAGKADMLRDRFLKDQESALAKGGEGLRSIADSRGIVRTNEDGRFVESPLGAYLTALAFMEAGETAHQEVAGRRLLDSIRQQSDIIGPVRQADFAQVPTMRPGDANLAVVALSGRGPWKRSERLGPIPIGDWPVYFEVPVLETRISEAASARLVIDGPTPENPEQSGPYKVDLALVEDLGRVAAENHRRELPLIQLRAILRASLKSGGAFAASRAVRDGQRDNDALHLATILAGMAFVALTEKADTRAWIFLPGQAHVGTVSLAPGRHRLRVEFLSASGGLVHTTTDRFVNVNDKGDAFLERVVSGDVDMSAIGGPAGVEGAGGLATLVEHFWR